jgi:ABC-type polysaccharide/polyol phosphate export permease
MSVEATETRVVEPGTKVTTRIRDLIRYHELIVNLVRKELRVKYKNSVLGFVWSMLNPAMTIAIFWIVFTKFLGNSIPKYPIWILCGILAWNLWQGSLGSSVGSFIGNSSLVTKVYFPREVLPLASIGANLMHFFFQFLVLLGALLLFRIPITLATLELVPAALVTELLVLCGLCLIVAVINVYFRDVQHLLELTLLAWFWMTPIVYPVALPVQHLGKLAKLFMLNPMTSVVLALQRGIYQHTSYRDSTPKHVHQDLLLHVSTLWYLRNLAIVSAAAIVLIMVGWAIFRRLEWRLAEEL